MLCLVYGVEYYLLYRLFRDAASHYMNLKI